jgi:pyruvate dehydrogenase E2 component (dihydrolipoamide acetyltransferase)
VITEVVIPMLGITVEKGIIREWLKKEGDKVEKGESLFIVEAEKVTTEVESPASGVLGRIIVPVDVEMPVLTVVALIAETGEKIPERYSKDAAVSRPPAAETVLDNEKVEAASPEKPAEILTKGPLKIAPAARRLAREKGVIVENINGTGPEGVIVFSDVEKAALVASAPSARASTLAAKLADREGVVISEIKGSGVRGRIMTGDVKSKVKASSAQGLGRIIPMSSMRQIIARKMSESAFTAPHIYFFTDVCMDPALNFRKEILPDFEESFGHKFSINDMIIKAAALNISDFPMLNATIVGNDIHILPEINVCMAIALEDGLIVPAIKNTNLCGLSAIARQRIDLVERAKSGKLTMEELQSGTFTISSLAQYDVTYFTAIINPPQSGILSVGKTRDELYLEDGNVKTRKIATFGLSVDHRIIDGAVAADFLQHFKKKLEKPQFTFMHQ